MKTFLTILAIPLFLVCLKLFTGGVFFPMYLLMIAAMIVSTIGMLIRMNIGRFKRLGRIVRREESFRPSFSPKGIASRFSLLFSLLMNLAYAIFEMILSLVQNNMWLGAMAVYYLMLTSLRISVLTSMSEGLTPDGQRKRCRETGWGLLVFTVLLTAMGVLCIQRRMVFSKGNLYVSILFTVMHLSSMVRIFRRDRSGNQPLITAAHRITAAKTLTSVFTLATAAASQLASEELFLPLVTVMGAVVLAAELFMAFDLFRSPKSVE